MSNFSTIVSYLQQMGFNKVAIAGIMGNLMMESGFDPNSGNQREGAIGIAQWEGSRRVTLQRLASSMGRTENNLGVQLEMLRQELEGRHLVDELNHAGSAGNAAAIFDHKFENSAGTTRSQRINYANQYFTSGKISGGGGTTSTNYGTVSGSSGSGSRTNMTSAQYQAALGDLSGLVNSVPELRNLLHSAMSSHWTSDEFIQHVEQSHWWRTHSQALRQNLALKISDPATYASNLKQATEHVHQLASSLGITLIGDQASKLANQYMLGVWDDPTLQQHMAAFYKIDLSHGGKIFGQAATIVQNLHQIASDYGMYLSRWARNNWTELILSGQQSVDSFKQFTVNNAKAKYPGLVKQLDSGLTVNQIADPYRQSMGRLLEIDPNTIGTDSATLNRALQGTTTDKGTTVMPMWKFEEELRADPRWQYTQNAKDTMSTALMKIGQDFGFSQI